MTPPPLDVEVDVPEVLDLSSLRATGLQQGEEELPEDAPKEPPKGERGGEKGGTICSL